MDVLEGRLACGQHVPRQGHGGLAAGGAIGNVDANLEGGAVATDQQPGAIGALSDEGGRSQPGNAIGVPTSPGTLPAQAIAIWRMNEASGRTFASSTGKKLQLESGAFIGTPSAAVACSAVSGHRFGAAVGAAAAPAVVAGAGLDAGALAPSPPQAADAAAARVKRSRPTAA